MNLEETICYCLDVTGNDIKEAVDNGATTFEEVQEKTGAGSICGSCEDNVRELIDELLNK